MGKTTPKKLVAFVLSAVMALSCLATGAVSTASAREADELDPSGMNITAGSQYGSTPIGNAFDDNTGTMWESNWSSGGDISSYDNHYVVIDLGKEYKVSGIRYTPRQDSGTNGTITQYTIYAGLTEEGMSQVAAGSWDANREVKTASFGPYRVRYIKIKAEATMHDSSTLTTSASEIGIIGAEIGEGEEVPQPPVRETDENGNYIVTFTDENRKGDFQIKTGEGTIEYTYGEGAEGYAVFTGMNNTLAVDNMSDAIPDGFIEAELTDLDGVGRWGLIFRYTNENQYGAICYDGGWSWQMGTSWGGLSGANYSIKQGVTYDVRVEYTGANIRFLIKEKTEDEYTVVYNGKVSQLDLPAGKSGVRTWGTGQSGAPAGHVKIDNYVTGSFNGVVLEPDSTYIPSTDVGKYDVNVALSQTNNAFSKITVDDADLDTQFYTINETKDVVTISKDYIATLAGQTKVLTFHFEDGFMTTFTLEVEGKVDTEQYDYVRDFAADGIEGFEKVSGNVTSSGINDAGEFEVVNATGNTLFIDQNSKALSNVDVEYKFNTSKDNGNMGIVVRYVDENNWTAIYPASGGGNGLSWQVKNSKGEAVALTSGDYCEDGQRIYSDRIKPYTLKVRVVGKVLTVYLDNAEIYNGYVDIITTGAGKQGIFMQSGSSITASYLGVTNVVPAAAPETVEETTIQNETLKVTLDKNFPRVIGYELLSTGATTAGEETPNNIIEINNKQYTPVVGEAVNNGTSITYPLTINITDEKAVTMNVNYALDGYTINYTITDIDDSQFTVYTINFPEQALVSMKSTQGDAELRVNNYNSETIIDLSTVTEADKAYKETSIAVLSDGSIGATINNGSIKARKSIAYRTANAEDGSIVAKLWTNEFMYKGIDNEVIEEPWTKIAITGDRNDDGVVDFQDAAIARRDDAGASEGQYGYVVGYENYQDSMTMIAMNVGSAAQYPFLRILDNVKKIYLATDGFNQNIIIKGYQSEGHDASHPDFANYNTRAGGLEDFLVLLQNAGDYNTNIGVHINHTEVYPEAPQYSIIGSTVGGWSWYDSAVQIKRENDILMETYNGEDYANMGDRIQQLYDDTQGLLKNIYVDVYFDTRWAMYKLQDEINSKGIAISTEYVNMMDKASAFGHHIDSRFNTAGNLVRFVSNETQDIFGNSTLFRGMTDRATVGIDGWQTSYKLGYTIQQFFINVLPNRYLAQFPIYKYNSNTEAVLGDDMSVVTKVVNGVNVITKDGKEIANGNKIFIPWDAENETKIYHWNQGGGESTWYLPDSWDGVETVYLYELSDTGRGEAVPIDVDENGQVTIDAKAATGYVVYKELQAEQEDVNWGEGGYVKDPGFDSHDPNYAWNAGDQSNISFVNNNNGNTEAVVSGEGTLYQTITGLTPGQQYTASVWATVSDSTATIEVKNGDETLSNYMERSNVRYGLHHNSKYQSYMQRMWVTFVAESDTATITLKTTGTGTVNFDDVRVLATTRTELTGTEICHEDFESGDEGYGVFTTTESDNSHLSEANPGVTNDVIDGNYSMKVRAGDYLRTMPYTVRLEPNTKYVATIDYYATGNGAFTFAAKDDITNEVLASVSCGNPQGWVKTTATLEFTTGENEAYIDITRGSQSEYILDNFIVKEMSATMESLTALYNECQALNADDYTEDSYAVLTEAMTAAKSVIDKGENATEDEIFTAYNDLLEAKGALVGFATAEDIARLQTVIDEMKNIVESDYVKDDNWTAFQNKITEAEALTTAQKVTAAQIDEMINALYAAKDALTTVANWDELDAIIEKAEAIKTANFNDGQDMVAFTSALAEAKQLRTQSGVGQSQIDSMTEKLTNAYNAIVPKAESEERAAFGAYIEKAEAALAAMADGEDKEAMAAAIEEAKAIFEDTVTGNVGKIWAVYEKIEKYMPEQGETILGDVDGDGKLTVTDATYIQRYIVRLLNDGDDLGNGLTFNLSVADYDGDGIVSVNDATRIQLYLAGY